MAQQYTVSRLNPDGTTNNTVEEMSPEMETSFARMKAFDEANPGFWCDCGTPETGRIEPRGHSVDVFCKNCAGCLQVG